MLNRVIDTFKNLRDLKDKATEDGNKELVRMCDDVLNESLDFVDDFVIDNEVADNA